MEKKLLLEGELVNTQSYVNALCTMSVERIESTIRLQASLFDLERRIESLTNRRGSDEKDTSDC